MEIVSDDYVNINSPFEIRCFAGGTDVLVPRGGVDLSEGDDNEIWHTDSPLC